MPNIRLLFAKLAIATLLVLLTSSCNRAPATSPFPDDIYLNAPSSLNGQLTFKARVVTQLSRSSSSGSIQFRALQTMSGEELDLVVIVPNDLLEEHIVPGQIYSLTVDAKNGNMLAVDMHKF